MGIEGLRVEIIRSGEKKEIHISGYFIDIHSPNYWNNYTPTSEQTITKDE